MNKAVFFDMDGTLINLMKEQLHITNPVRDAIFALKKAGHGAFIATGRPYQYLSDEFIQDGLFDGYVLMNGAMVMMGDKVIYDKPLDKRLVRKVVALCDTHNVEYALEGKRDIFIRRNSPMTEDFCRAIKVPLENFVRDFDVNHIDVYKMEFLAKERGGSGVFEKFMAIPELTGVIDRYHGKNMELYAKDETKASGILHVLDYLGIPVEKSYAFGDGMNDIEMMETVGTSLVMENGQKKLKEKADYIVPSVDDDGVMHGIYAYILEGMSI